MLESKNRENGHGENNTPKTFLGTIVSDREEKPKIYDHNQR